MSGATTPSIRRCCSPHRSVSGRSPICSSDLGWLDLAGARLLEVGCGTGCNLLDFLRLGFRPEHLQGIELLPASVEWARRDLPASVRITLGDAAAAAASVVPEASQDIVFQSTVFTSLLDDEFQQRLADRMWRWLRPGGGILWYDFTVNNPRNPDVRGVPVARIRQLFPHGKMRVRRLTLAPPVARAVTRLHPTLYTVLNSMIWLRTHVLVWVEKPPIKRRSPGPRPIEGQWVIAKPDTAEP